MPPGGQVMALFSTYQSTDLPLLSTLYEPPPKHLISVLGEALLLAGRLEEAQACAEQAQALAREHQERGNQAYVLRLLGEIAARRDSPETAPAEASYRQARALADELGMRPLQAHCHRGLGTL